MHTYTRAHTHAHTEENLFGWSQCSKSKQETTEKGKPAKEVSGNVEDLPFSSESELRWERLPFINLNLESIWARTPWLKQQQLPRHKLDSMTSNGSEIHRSALEVPCRDVAIQLDLCVHKFWQHMWHLNGCRLEKLFLSNVITCPQNYIPTWPA